jgi:hypothetical protein
MPKGVYHRQFGPPKPEPVPLPVPPMPPRKGRWREATKRSWASWFESGRASLLDEAALAALGRLMILLDKAAAEDWPLGLAKEIRLAEASILRQAKASPAAIKAPPPADERREAKKAKARAVYQQNRERVGEELKLGRPATEAEVAAHELAALA